MEIIEKYFDDLTEKQIDQFAMLGPLYNEWNQKINLISRKDIGELYMHHVLHSLAIAKFIRFKSASKIMDLGTGGGFPAIPLAIYFPDVQVYAVDSIGKKIKVIQDIGERLQLDNLHPLVSRAEEVKDTFDFVVSRAVATLPVLAHWTKNKLKRTHQHAIPNGLIALKGPTYAAEMKGLTKADFAEAFPVRKWFSERFFEEKFLIYLQGK